MKRIIRLTESDLTRIVKRVISEKIEFDVEDPDFGATGEGMRKYPGTYSWYDPEKRYYRSKSGYETEHNEPSHSNEWEDFEFEDFEDLESSDIPNRNISGLSKKSEFEKLRSPISGKVHIRKNPHSYKRHNPGLK